MRGGLNTTANALFWIDSNDIFVKAQKEDTEFNDIQSSGSSHVLESVPFPQHEVTLVWDTSTGLPQPLVTKSLFRLNFHHYKTYVTLVSEQPESFRVIVSSGRMPTGTFLTGYTRASHFSALRFTVTYQRRAGISNRFLRILITLMPTL